jgi:SPOR domain
MNKSDKYMQLTERQVSTIAAGLLMILFFVFIAGYYWGKQAALDPVGSHIMEDALADKVYYACCTFNPVAQNTLSDSHQEDPVYYAPLERFNSLPSAQAYVQKMEHQGCAVKIIEHQSKTSKGVEQQWYQVITAPLRTKEEVAQVLDTLKKRILLKDRTIVALKPEQQKQA